MDAGRRVLIAYGWDRLLYEIVAAALWNDGWRVVGSHAQLSETEAVDLVLVYVSRPAVAMEEVRNARARYPGANIIVLGGEITDDELVKFVETGAGAYVSGHQGLPELLDAMRMVRENRSPSPARITQRVLENISRLTRTRDTRADARLTPREKDILYLVSTGMGNKEIADSLSISPNTVKNHVHNLLQKLNVRNRHEAAWIEPRLCHDAARPPLLQRSARP
jgi:two-component system, NarL family, nitrate/nitrite response regulator NarL